MKGSVVLLRVLLSRSPLPRDLAGSGSVDWEGDRSFSSAFLIETRDMLWERVRRRTDETDAPSSASSALWSAVSLPLLGVPDRRVRPRGVGVGVDATEGGRSGILGGSSGSLVSFSIGELQERVMAAARTFGHCCGHRGPVGVLRIANCDSRMRAWAMFLRNVASVSSTLELALGPRKYPCSSSMLQSDGIKGRTDTSNREADVLPS